MSTFTALFPPRWSILSSFLPGTLSWTPNNDDERTIILQALRRRRGRECESISYFLSCHHHGGKGRTSRKCCGKSGSIYTTVHSSAKSSSFLSSSTSTSALGFASGMFRQVKFYYKSSFLFSVSFPPSNPRCPYFVAQAEVSWLLKQ